MAESLLHMNYVRHIADYTERTFPNLIDSWLYIDLPESSKHPSATIGGHIPDMYYKDKHVIIIGEAKTENDIDNEHTKAQLKSYIDEVSMFQGERHIIYCSGMLSFSQIKNMILRLKRHDNIDGITFHILDNYSKVNTI